MKKLRSKKQILLYSMAGLGVNMLNLIVGTYLCDALMVEGFSTNIENWTYANKTLVVAGVWSVMIFLAKVLDGVEHALCYYEGYPDLEDKILKFIDKVIEESSI